MESSSVESQNMLPLQPWILYNNLCFVEGPTQVKINSIDSKINGIEEKDLTIRCNAEGGDKTPDMILQVKNQNFTMFSQRNIEHTLLEVDKQYDGTTVTCFAGYQELSYFPETDTAIIYLDRKFVFKKENW